jgi:hypothetical protein
MGSLCNAAAIINWLRYELDAEIYLEPARDQPNYYYVRPRAPKLRNRVARQRVHDAINGNGSDRSRAMGCAMTARSRPG